VDRDRVMVIGSAHHKQVEGRFASEHLIQPGVDARHAESLREIPRLRQIWAGARGDRDAVNRLQPRAKPQSRPLACANHGDRNSHTTSLAMPPG
jgi:hypothetical protein